LFQTKALVKFINNITGKKSKVIWFPNARKRQLQTVGKSFNKRFVFISHVLRTKGISEIIEAAGQLPDDYVIDAYGPIKENEITERSFDGSKVKYKGALNPDEVIPTLLKYDVLLHPSYKEGYAGIILEALSIGMPVITTNLSTTSEIITDKKEGILIPPKDSKAIAEAIMSISQENYWEYSQNALERFGTFDEDMIYPKTIEQMLGL
jgi:glycosyltransferase involved in cell wall biosynthesis